MLENLQNLGFGGTGIPDALSKTLAELQGLTFNVVDGANDTEIPIPDMEAEDTVKAIINLTDLAEVDVAYVTVGDRRAFGTLTVGTGVVDGDKVVVRGKTYTFTEVEETIAYNAPPNVIPISVGPSGVDVDVVAARLAKVIMSSDSLLSASADGAIVTVVARTAGVGGNAYTLNDTLANGHVTKSGATFSGGAATNGIVIPSSPDATAGKKLLVIWFNKTP